ncbi:MAG: hypothetical protein JRF65_04235, partial [Deltaproteobacteria bacterium]|nr:hypothetical protein [Deltaproteobacteria bacterium]
SYSIPADAVPGTTYARFRLSSAGSLAPTGSAADGEVEDYEVTIEDNPAIDIEKATNGEDADDPPGPNVPVGSTVTWTYVVTNTGNVTLYDLVVTDDKITNDASEIDCGGGNNTIASLAPQADQTCTATGTAVDTSGMTDGAYENTGSVVGWTVDGGTGTQVSDDDPSHYNASEADVFDFGDVPDSYGTVQASSGAYHRILMAAGAQVPIFYLGNAVDQETDGQPGANADGDDTNGDTPDDEDGVAFTTDLIAGQDASFDVSAAVPTEVDEGQMAKLDAWIDFDGDGVFEPGEHLNGGVSWNLADGVNYTFSFTVPAGATAGPTYARFRLSEDGELPPTGDGGDGEVEDYRVIILVPAIDIEKSTNGQDADDPTGPILKPGDEVTWTYVVTNTGDVPLVDVVVVDDSGTPGDTGDDFEPIFVGADDGNDGVLSPGEIWNYEAMGTAVVGQYENMSNVIAVTAVTVENSGNMTARANGEFQTVVSDSDPSHYLARQLIIPTVSGPGLFILALVLGGAAWRVTRRRRVS